VGGLPGLPGLPGSIGIEATEEGGVFADMREKSKKKAATKGNEWSQNNRVETGADRKKSTSIYQKVHYGN